jgi:hypothetical protein
VSILVSKPFYLTVSDSPAARNLSRQSKKVGCGCPHYFRDHRLTVFEQVTKNSVLGTSTLHSNETTVLEYEG